MPATQVLFYQDRGGKSPVVDWFRALRQHDEHAFANCLARVRMLARFGHELRAKRGTVQYRMLYFFHGRNIAVLGHAIIKKESSVPAVEIQRALQRKRLFEVDPRAHTYEGEVADG